MLTYADVFFYGLQAISGVREEDMPVLYSAAAAFIYPSSYEGFGMPPLEASACLLVYEPISY